MKKILILLVLVLTGCENQEFCPCVETLYEKVIVWEPIKDDCSKRRIDTIIVYQKNVPLQKEYYYYMGDQFKTVKCFDSLYKY